MLPSVITRNFCSAVKGKSRGNIEPDLEIGSWPFQPKEGSLYNSAVHCHFNNWLYAQIIGQIFGRVRVLQSGWKERKSIGHEVNKMY